MTLPAPPSVRLGLLVKAPTVHPVTTDQVHGKRVMAYRNLHNGLWSLKEHDSGHVAGHTGSAVIRDAEFHVSEAGRQRVLKEGHKNVHAGVRGTVEHVDAAEPPNGAVPVSYNPYRSGSFYRKDTMQDVHRADAVHMTPKGVFAVNPS